ncbi:hypothetical protein GTY41_23665 [Streptomyces sp. SID685]|uniref:acyl carrier protein n=1 Tax=Streptomyces griseofuscus TaxID=146922 RepID=UPI00136D5E5A|nr:hypothetical protein [Streptomyces sp. SID685]
MPERPLDPLWRRLLAAASGSEVQWWQRGGGHSLSLINLVGQLDQRLGIQTDILMVLENPTVAKFTSHWNSMHRTDGGNR